MTLLKSMIVPVTFGLFLAGCHWAGKTRDVQADSTAAGRPALIAQLKAIHRLLASGDKQMIAQLFTYPLPDSVGHIYPEDTAFASELEKNGGYLTKEMFLRHFDAIDAGLNLGEYRKVFDHLNMDSLLYKDMLESEDDTDNEPCTNFYHIRVEGDTLIWVSYGVSAVNPNYSVTATRKAAGKDTLADGMRGRDSAADEATDSVEHDDLYNEGACEHTIYWIYRFDGRRLQLFKHDVAD